MSVAESVTPRTRGLRWCRRGSGVAAMTLAAVTLTACTSGTTSQESRSDTYAGDIATVVLQFDDSGAKQIGFTTAALNAHIVGADRHDIQVRRTFEYTDGDKPEETIEQEWGGLTITTRCPDRFAVGHPTCIAHYEIEVPYGSVVRADTRSGDLTVTDTRAEVDLRSHSGDVGMVVAPGDGTRYAVEAVSADGHTTVDVLLDPAGVPVRLTTEDGAATATTAQS
ncbi:hypothetical protein AB4Z09_15500 [Rhodococcus sp. TAF43]|uniref:hypothetical protein n=1 Tax=unclassified Rhodococcus (in: high G+C Gram-positive bacteria) TaxID=192944 RepID=UPI001582811C|nr:hypothetical protein [Rhodococcus sp. W8901]QKT12005.1 hypothetical protein HUN07_15950 [Rhodococcus sp. W8901]